MEGPLVLAHRGWSRAGPQNTLKAIQGACEAGCDGAEFDVRVLRDDTPVLHHDADVRTPRGRVALSTLALPELRGLLPDLTRLADVVEWARSHPGFWLNVEVKERDALPATLEVLGPRAETLALTSFDLALAARAKRLRPACLVGWINDEKRDDLADVAAEAGLDLLVLHRSNARGSLLARARARGLRVWVWGVNWNYQWRALQTKGATGAITDAPRRLLGRRRAAEA